MLSFLGTSESILEHEDIFNHEDTFKPMSNTKWLIEYHFHLFLYRKAEFLFKLCADNAQSQVNSISFSFYYFLMIIVSDNLSLPVSANFKLIKFW